MNTRSAYLNYVCAGAPGCIAPILVDEVIYFWADDASTLLVTDRGEFMIHTPLSELLPMLDPRKFWQVQRNTVVNIDRIERVMWKDPGQVELKIKDRVESIIAGHPYCRQFREQ